MLVGYHRDICVCEFDLVNFTQWCGSKTPNEIFNCMSLFNDRICDLISSYDNVEKIELVGDSCLLVSTSIKDMILLCVDILDMFPYLREGLFYDDNIDIRIGIHIGDLTGGILKSPNKNQVYGQTVNIASRLEQLAIPGTIHVSEDVYTFLKKGNEEFLKMFSMGKNKLVNLKGIGDFNSITLFIKRENFMVADDNKCQVMVLSHIINKQHNTTCLQITSIVECFELLKKQYFEDVVILDRFFEDVDAFIMLKEFRLWEKQHRKEVQKFILISADNSSHLCEAELFICKDVSFYKKIDNAIRSMKQS